MTFRSLALALAFSAALPLCAFAQDADPPDDELPLPPMAPVGAPAGARKITDGALTCEQILAESLALEQVIAQQRAGSEAAQREANAAQDAVMKQASGGTAVPLASSLLGMVPGVSLVNSLAAQAALSAQRSAMQQGAAQMTASYQRMAQAQEQLAYAQARNDHLVGLFLQKKCKVPG